MVKRFRQHRLNCFIRYIDCTLHLNYFLVSGFYITRQHLQNPVRIDFELNADTRNSFWSCFKFDLKFTQSPIVARHFAFALQNIYGHRALVMHRRGKHFACSHGNG